MDQEEQGGQQWKPPKLVARQKRLLTLSHQYQGQTQSLSNLKGGGAFLGQEKNSAVLLLNPERPHGGQAPRLTV